MMIPDARQGEAILAVIDSGSFEQAAAALHLTPSAVSQRVSGLESAMVAIVLDRHERGVGILVKTEVPMPSSALRRNGDRKALRRAALQRLRRMSPGRNCQVRLM